MCHLRHWVQLSSYNMDQYGSICNWLDTNSCQNLRQLRGDSSEPWTGIAYQRPQSWVEQHKITDRFMRWPSIGFTINIYQIYRHSAHSIIYQTGRCMIDTINGSRQPFSMPEMLRKPWPCATKCTSSWGSHSITTIALVATRVLSWWQFQPVLSWKNTWKYHIRRT